MTSKDEIQGLIQEARCFGCFTNASLVDLMKLAYLSRIAALSTGGTPTDTFMQAGNYGGGQPPWTPTGDIAFAIDTSTTPGTQWTWYSGAWH